MSFFRVLYYSKMEIENNKKENIKYLKENLKNMERWIKEKQESKPELKQQTIRKVIEESIEKILKNVLGDGEEKEGISPQSLILHTSANLALQRYMKSNEKEFKRLYNEMQKLIEEGNQEEINKRLEKAENMDPFLMFDLKQSKKYFMAMLVIKGKQFYETERKEYIDKKTLGLIGIVPKEKIEEYREKAIENISLKEQKKEEYQYMKNCLEETIKLSETQLKNLYIKSIQFMGEFFDDFHKLEDYRKIYISSLEKIEMKEMASELENKEDIKQLFSKESLQECSIEQLSAIYCSWMNRLTKECININQTIMVMDELGILEENEIQEGKVKTSNKVLENILLKCKCVDFISQNLMHNLIRKLESKQTITEKQIDKEINKQMEVLKKDYKIFFDRQLKGRSHELEADIEKARDLESLVFLGYQKKEQATIALISELVSNKRSENWGIIQEDVPIQEQKYVLVADDCIGFNRPIRVHCLKKTLIDFMELYQGEPKMRLYNGAEDMSIDGKLVKNPLLYRVGEKTKHYVKKQAEGMKDRQDERARHIKHIAYLSGVAPYPEHLKEEEIIVKKKGKKRVKCMQRVKPKYDIDLVTGEIYQTGKLVKNKGRNSYESKEIQR